MENQKVSLQLEKIAANGLGCHSISTLLYYFSVAKKYEATKQITGCHFTACESCGISEKHIYKILHIVKLVSQI